jgi:O-antigen/teichoic acid export membrane protein
MILGILLLIIGLIFLLKNLGIITGEVWGIFWPSLLIALGFYFIFKKKKNNWWMHDWSKYESDWHKRFYKKENS